MVPVKYFLNKKIISYLSFISIEAQYLRLCCKLCIHTLLSTEIDKTAASVSLDIGGPSSFVTGKNCKPVTNIE